MKNRELKELIKADTFRYYGGARKQFLWRIRNVSLRYTIIQRKAHYYSLKDGFFAKIKEIWYRYMLNSMSRKYMIQIPYEVTIGKGFNIVHFGRVIVAPSVHIGENVNMFTGVTIGSTVRGIRAGVPTIGNCVWIGPNVAIVGKVTIGNNVLIAANSYVNFDVPDNSIVIGNPGKIIHKENATEGYICQKV